MYLPDPSFFNYSFGLHVMSVTVRIRGNLRRNERKYKRRLRTWRDNILKNDWTMCCKVICLQFLCTQQGYSGVSADRRHQWMMKILPAQYKESSLCTSNKLGTVIK